MTRAQAGSLLLKELRELLLGRAFWPLLTILSLLVGAGFRQSLSLYSEASRAALAAPELGRGLSPFDGVMVPTFGPLYLAATLLWPFVAMRQLGGDIQSGAIKLWLQLPASPTAQVAAKLAALAIGWSCMLAVPLSALALWHAMGGHVDGWELLALVVGHSLYAAVVVCLSFLATAWSESVPTASLIVLSATLGSWALDFASAGHDGWLAQLSVFSLSAVLRPWERGLFFAAQLASWLLGCLGLIALTLVGLDHGRRASARILRAGLVAVTLALSLLAVRAPLTFSRDLTESRRNSFAASEEAALSQLEAPLRVEVFLRPEDPRREDFERAVLSKLRRVVPDIEIRSGETTGGRFGAGEDSQYGRVVYTYSGRTDISRSTSPREVLPILWALAKVDPPTADGSTYPGYPLVAVDRWSAAWFFGILPALAAIGAAARWWWPSRRPKAKGSDFMKSKGFRAALGLVLAASFSAVGPAHGQAAGASGGKAAIVLDFSSESVGAEPKSMLPVVGTWGIGEEAGNRVLVIDGRRWKEGTPSANLADKAKSLYGERYAEFLDSVQAFAYFPYAAAQGIEDFRGGEISLRFKAISGRIDQAAGILFSLKPNGDYLALRANPLEDNLVLWQLVRGKRSSVKWIRNTPTPTGQWHTLRLVVTGAKVEGYLGDKLYLEHTLSAPVSGRVGVWSKADSHVYVDDFRVDPR